MLDLGDPLPLGVEIRNPAGSLENAGAVTVTVTLPDGSTAIPAVTNPADGVYQATWITQQEGRHLVRWVATGINACALADVYDVRPAALPAILSLADARGAVGNQSTRSDEELRGYVEAATSVVEYYCGAVVRRTVAEDHDGAGCHLALRCPPVLAVSAVTEGGVLVDPAGYYVNRAAGVITRRTGGWPSPWAPGYRTVTVTYTAGRTVIPGAMTTAAKIIVAHLWAVERGDAGAPRFGGASDDDVVEVPGLGYAVPSRAVELLVPHPDAPGFA